MVAVACYCVINGPETFVLRAVVFFNEYLVVSGLFFVFGEGRFASHD
jgi:hypothetical protein